MSNISETLTPTTCLKSTAVHLQFVQQYAPHLYRRTFLASLSFEERETRSTPPICTAVRLLFARQCAPHLYGGTFGKILGVGVTGTFLTLWANSANSACADCPGFLVLGAAPAPASTFVSEPQMVTLG